VSLAAPKVNPGAQAAPPAAQGATAFQLGGDQTPYSRVGGNVGRLALRVGQVPASAPTASTTGV
jgi:hypothetical protein